MTTGPTHALSGARYRWMDYIRGFAIIAVVYHHAVDAATWHRSGLPSAFTAIDDALSPFRIPLLMFLSGMLLCKSLTKPAKRYFDGKLRRIAWPYLVWTTIVLFIVGWLHTVSDVALIFLPVTHLWYLWALLLFYLVSFVLRRAPSWVWLTTIAASIVADVFVDADRVIYLWAFFALGHLYATSQRNPLIRRTIALSSRWWMRLALLAVAGVAVGASVAGVHVQYEVTFMAAVMAGVLAVVQPFTLPPDHFATRALSYVGTHSLVFYCVHWCVIGLTANALKNETWANAGIVLLITFAVGLFGSWLFAVGSDWLWIINALFAFPRLRRAAPSGRHRKARAQASQGSQLHVAPGTKRLRATFGHLRHRYAGP